MSAETVTDAVARHFAENVAGVKAAYASGAGAQANVRTLPAGIESTPAAVAWWRRYELVPGSFERLRHFIDVDLWFLAGDAAAAYKTSLPFVTLVIASFRTNVGLFGTADIATATSGDAPEGIEEINGQPYMRLVFHVEALESGAQTYSSS